MKKPIFSFVLITVLTGVMTGQGIYVRAGSGYGLPIATSVLGQNDTRVDNNGVYTSSSKGVKGSYGAGINFNIAFGYKFNENLIFELNSQYLMSNIYKTQDNYHFIGTGYSYIDNNNVKTSAKALFLNPSFIFSAGFGKAAPYARFGIVLGSPKVKSKELLYNDADGIDSTARRWEYSKGISFGFQGAIGMNWKINDKLDIFTELNYVNMAYYPGEYNLTQDINVYDHGTPIDYLANMSLSQKKTIFKKQLDIYTDNSDPLKPHVALRQSIPFSSVSLQVGVRFQLWKKSE